MSPALQTQDLLFWLFKGACRVGSGTFLGNGIEAVVVPTLIIFEIASPAAAVFQPREREREREIVSLHSAGFWVDGCMCVCVCVVPSCPRVTKSGVASLYRCGSWPNARDLGKGRYHTHFQRSARFGTSSGTWIAQVTFQIAAVDDKNHA